MKKIAQKKSLPLALAGLVMFSFVAATNSFAIPASYGEATHSDDQWQELAYYEGSNLVSQAGVFWSTDGGTTWGQNTELHVGDNLQFRFHMHKQTVGTHYSDHLKVWLDWNLDGDFDENSTEVIAYEEETLRPREDGNLGTNNVPNSPNFTYYSEVFTILDSFVDQDLWLRARVTCSESLVGWNQQFEPSYQDRFSSFFNATGRYYQGEVEEYNLTVSRDPVPEPATMLLFGTGLAGLAGWRRRKTAKK